MTDLFRNIWIVNGILAGSTVLVFQLACIVAIISKAFKEMR